MENIVILIMLTITAIGMWGLNTGKLWKSLGLSFILVILMTIIVMGSKI